MTRASRVGESRFCVLALLMPSPGHYGLRAASDAFGWIPWVTDLDSLARDVEEAADCYSWGPGVLRLWLATHDESTPFLRALERLVASGSVELAIDALSRDSGCDPGQGRIFEASVQLVGEGATPNTIRARLQHAAADARPQRAAA